MAPARGGSKSGRSRGSARQRHARTDRDGDISMGGPPPARKPTQNGHSKPASKGPQVSLFVKGWVPKPVTEVVSVLERRASAQLNKATKATGSDHHRILRSIKHSVKGPTIYLTVWEQDAPHFLSLDGTNLGTTTLSIVSGHNKDIKGSLASADAASTQALRDAMKAFISRRYVADQKLLNLNSIDKDEQIQSIGLGKLKDTPKFFTALMKVCDSEFKTAEEKKNTVESITLADNDLTDILPVIALAFTFPQLKNLDLADNKFANVNALTRWKTRFGSLEHIVLRGNPLEQNSPGYTNIIKGWWRSLRLVNGTAIRSEEDIPKPFLIEPALFKDEAGIGEAFVKNFFVLFDNNRDSLVHTLYDAESKFSYSVNTKAPRAPTEQTDFKPQDWSRWIKGSRNLKHLNHAPAKMARKHRGVANIVKVWSELPGTRHPDILASFGKFCFECQLQPFVPDPSGTNSSGVNGLLITCHGEFEEIDLSMTGNHHLRSFDRTFIIGPGGPGGVRVISDIMTVRAYGGSTAWKPTPADQRKTNVPVITPQQALPVAPAAPQQQFHTPPPMPQSIPTPNPMISNTAYNPMIQNANQTAVPQQLSVADIMAGAVIQPPNPQDELLAAFSKSTNLKPEFATDCLTQVGWDPEKAWSLFQSVKPTLPANCFFGN